jgi:hypothetical protein
VGEGDEQVVEREATEGGIERRRVDGGSEGELEVEGARGGGKGS